ncbi:HD-GYP domain-containing protein [Flaviflagellibacter deserti]|uniref:HD-GYP domain-containing protein n=1 Tax=Flaviflagellibacter deserti TaxID=2267266 RepID=A0ABV9Z1C8_9HYPH
MLRSQDLAAGHHDKVAAVIVVGDDTVSSPVYDLQDADFVDIADEKCARYDFGSPQAVVFDVALSRENIAIIQSLNPVLPKKRVFSVDLKSFRARIQANSLGATALINRPIRMRELNYCIQELIGTTQRKRDRRQVEIDRSIKGAASALTSMFDGISTGAKLDVEGALRACGDIGAAIPEFGQEKWLDNIRKHHVSTFQHCLLVTSVATMFGQSLGMRRADVVALTMAGMLHDIGKATIPVALLDKPGKLTDAELKIIKSHPEVGSRYLSSTVIRPDILHAVRHHHEALDGSGYPDGLSGHQIPDMTRILTVCDIYAALIERRSYKEPLPPAAAIDVLRTLATGGKVEGALVEALASAVFDRTTASA